LEMRSLDALETLDVLQPGNTLVALAAHLGKARLIDNVRL
jgi:pantothenate synthetase